MKTCPKCGELKALSDFYKSGSKLKARCVACTREDDASPHYRQKSSAPDWAQIIEQIRLSGLTLEGIGRHPEIGCSRRNISYLANSDRLHEPSHSRGEALIALWLERTGSTFEELPRAGPLTAWRLFPKRAAT